MEKTIYNPDYEKLIFWLKTKRKASGLTMRDLCKTLHCSIGYIQKVENGLHRLDVLQFVRYCDAIGADIHKGISILEKNKELL
jgi:transcriptional regulator with XRE-family HTH domain